jgi:hypothetical protein
MLVHLEAPSSLHLRNLWGQLAANYEVGFVVGEAPLP